MDYYRGHFIEIPVKAGYVLRLNERNSFQFTLGPYVSMVTERGYGDPISVGLNASAAFRHRCMSFGIAWQNPIFLNGPRDYYTNSFEVTIGINFGSDAWSHIGNAAMIASSVMGTVADAYLQYESTQQHQVGSYDNNNRTNLSSGSENGSSRSGSSISEQTSYNRDKATYGRYDSDLAAYFAGNKPGYDYKNAQRQMKKLREKWQNKGKSFPKSANETR